MREIAAGLGYASFGVEIEVDIRNDLQRAGQSRAEPSEAVVDVAAEIVGPRTC
jgi:hypothetical protein